MKNFVNEIKKLAASLILSLIGFSLIDYLIQSNLFIYNMGFDNFMGSHDYHYDWAFLGLVLDVIILFVLLLYICLEVIPWCIKTLKE